MFGVAQKEAKQNTILSKEINLKTNHKLMCGLLVLLSACSKAPAPPETIEELQSKLEGRWVFNPAHCQQQITDDGLFDHVVANNGILTGGILAKGQWYRPDVEEIASLTSKLSAFIKTNAASCKEALPTGEPLFIVFESFEQKFVLAYYSKSDAVFRIVDDSIIVGQRYDSEALARLSAIEH